MGASASTILGKNPSLLATSNFKRLISFETLPRDLQILIGADTIVDIELDRKAAASEELTRLRGVKDSILKDLMNKEKHNPPYKSIEALLQDITDIEMELAVLEPHSTRYLYCKSYLEPLHIINESFREVTYKIEDTERRDLEGLAHWTSIGSATVEDIIRLTEARTDVCLAFDNKSDSLLVNRISKSLVDKGYRTHLAIGPDESTLPRGGGGGDDLERQKETIISSVDKTKVVIVFVSRGFMNRVTSPRMDFVKLMFLYTLQAKFESGAIITVVTDPSMRDSSVSPDINAPMSTRGSWVGPLSALGNSMYLDFTDDAYYNSTIETLHALLIDKIPIGRTVDSILTNIQWDSFVT